LERAEDADQIAAYGAADAAVVHLDDLLFALLDEVGIDARLAELVLDHRDALAVLLLEDAVEERGLAAAEKSRQDGDGHHVSFFHRAILSVRKFLPAATDVLDFTPPLHYLLRTAVADTLYRTE